MLGAGALDYRISILRAATAVNSMNEPTDSWSKLVTVWANFVPISDGEKMRAGETLASQMVRFTVRYSRLVADVDPRDRISFRDAVYDINGVKVLGRKQFLEITATARAEAV